MQDCPPAAASSLGNAGGGAGARRRKRSARLRRASRISRLFKSMNGGFGLDTEAWNARVVRGPAGLVDLAGPNGCTMVSMPE